MTIHCGEKPRRRCWHRPIRESPSGRGGLREVRGRFSYPRTPAKNPLPVSWMQAYIAYIPRLKLLAPWAAVYHVANSLTPPLSPLSHASL
jgi:hypothetical protein